MAEIYPLPKVISPFAPRITPPNTGSPARAERQEQRVQQPPLPQPPPKPPVPTNAAANSPRGAAVDIQA
jgi:hypothetical protein